MERRLGRFLVADEAIRRDPDMAMLKALFSGMVPVRVESRFDMRAFEVVAFCDDFDLVPDGTEVPSYKILMEREETEEGDVVCKRGSVKKGELF